MRTTLMLIATTAVIGCKKGEDSYSFGGSQEPTQKNGAKTAAVVAEPKKYKILELDAKLKGKKPEEVIALIGKPEDTNIGRNYGNTIAYEYYYYNVVIDPVTGKNIPVSVNFNQNTMICRSVSFR